MARTFQMKIVTRYVAFDGEPFGDEQSCKAHERRNARLRLVGMTLEQVESAMTRADPELADAIEFLGIKIADARRASGALRRARNGLGKNSHGESQATSRRAESGGPPESVERPGIRHGLDRRR